MGVGGQRHDPAALPPWMARYPLYRGLGRPQDRSGQVLKISPHRYSIPRPSSSKRVAIPTTLSRPMFAHRKKTNYCKFRRSRSSVRTLVCYGEMNICWRPLFTPQLTTSFRWGSFGERSECRHDINSHITFSYKGNTISWKLIMCRMTETYVLNSSLSTRSVESLMKMFLLSPC